MLKDRIGKLNEFGPFVSISNDSNYIALSLVQGVVKIIPIDWNEREPFGDAFNCRLLELSITCMEFVESNLVFLFKNYDNEMTVKYYTINLSDQELKHTSIKLPMDNQSRVIVPLSIGYLVMGINEICLVRNGKKELTKTMSDFSVTSYSRISDNLVEKFIVGLENGNLALVALEPNEPKLQVRNMGSLSSCKCIEYLNEGFVYWGSQFGDSFLVKIQEEVRGKNGFLQEIERFTNFGPIVDFCVEDVDNQGLNQIISCSGAHNDATLKLIRSGVGLSQIAKIDLDCSLLKGLWAVGDLVIASFVSETKFFRISEEDVEEIDCINSEESTIYVWHCSNYVIRVTSSHVFLMDETQTLLDKISNDHKINGAVGFGNMLLYSSGKSLVSLIVENGKFERSR